MSLDTTTPFQLVLGKHTIPVRPLLTKAKDGGKQNTYWAVLTPKADGTRYASPFGVPIPAVGDTLPSTVTLIDQDGTEIVLPLTAKADTYIDRDTKVVKARKHPAVGVNQKVTLSGVDKQVKVSLSDTGDGMHQLKVTINGISGGGGNKTAVAISDL